MAPGKALQSNAFFVTQKPESAPDKVVILKNYYFLYFSNLNWTRYFIFRKNPLVAIATKGFFEFNIRTFSQ